MTYLRIAGFAGVSAIVACGTSGECSDDRECNSYVSIAFEDVNEWAPGSYTITVGGYGACRIEIPREASIPVCSEDNEGISFSASGSFFIPSDPDSLHVTVEKDSMPFKDIVVSPDYKRPRPECWPSCFEAHESIE